MWEEISKEEDSNGKIVTSKMRFQNGWLVRTVCTYGTVCGAGCSVHHVFIKDTDDAGKKE